MHRNISVLAERWRALTSTQRWNVAAAINGYRADALRIGQSVEGYDLAKEILEAAAEPEAKRATPPYEPPHPGTGQLLNSMPIRKAEPETKAATSIGDEAPLCPNCADWNPRECPVCPCPCHEATR